MFPSLCSLNQGQFPLSLLVMFGITFLKFQVGIVILRVLDFIPNEVEQIFGRWDILAFVLPRATSRLTLVYLLLLRPAKGYECQSF